MIRCVCLIGVSLFAACMIDPPPAAPSPGYAPPPAQSEAQYGPPQAGYAPQPAYAPPACRNPGATQLQIDNAGPDPVVIGRALIYPGQSILCVGGRHRRLVAVHMVAGPRGLVPALTADRRAVVGHPLALQMRGPRLATGWVNDRAVIALPMAFANLARQAVPIQPISGPDASMAPGAAPPPQQPQAAPPPPQQPQAAPPPPPQQPQAPAPAQPQPQPQPQDEPDDDTTDSLLDAVRGVEAPGSR